MKFIILCSLYFTFVGCGKIESVIEKTESIPGKMDELNNKMQYTKERLDEQTLAIASDHMYNLLDKNPDVVRLEVVAPAIIFASVLNSNQAVLWMEKVFKRIDTSSLETDFTKTNLLIIATVVAGELSENLIDLIVQNEILKSGAYKATAFKILALRFKYLTEFCFQSRTVDAGLNTLGLIQNSFQYLESLSKIAKYPFVDKLKFLPLGFSDNLVNSYQVDSFSMLSMINKFIVLSEDNFEVAVYFDDDAQNNIEIERQKFQFNQILLNARKLKEFWNTKLNN